MRSAWTDERFSKQWNFNIEYISPCRFFKILYKSLIDIISSELPSWFCFLINSIKTINADFEFGYLIAYQIAQKRVCKTIKEILKGVLQEIDPHFLTGIVQ